MEERIRKLYKELDFLLNHAPTEDDCSDAENEMYSDMANLKNSIENAGLDGEQGYDGIYE